MESMLYLTRATGNEVFRLGEITLIAGSAMRTFGLASSEAGDVANLLTYAANNSAQSVQDLGEALKTARPVCTDSKRRFARCCRRHNGIGANGY